jgi:hypothetical protein
MPRPHEFFGAAIYEQQDIPPVQRLARVLRAVVMRRSPKPNLPHVAVVINEAGMLLNPPRLHRTINGSPDIKASLPPSAVREHLNHHLILQLGAYAARNP